MAFELAQVVPWGRSFEEYVRMFALNEADLEGRILDCAGGPAGFNARMRRRGGRVVSCDPIYEYSGEQIRQRIAETYDTIIEGARRNRHQFVWGEISSPEALGEMRMAAMMEFLEDYPSGRREGRYRAMSLPKLDWPDGAFDLALCSHLLFLYAKQFDLQFHVEGVVELCRVAREVRIFPLVAMDGAASPHVAGVQGELTRRGYGVRLVDVPYEFQKGGNRMMVVGRGEIQKA